MVASKDKILLIIYLLSIRKFQTERRERGLKRLAESMPQGITLRNGIKESPVENECPEMGRCAKLISDGYVTLLTIYLKYMHLLYTFGTLRTIVPYMKSGLSISVYTILTILFMGFQCGHNKWIKYAKDFEVQVNPQVIRMHGDTLRFHISIDGRSKVLKPDHTQVFEVYVKGDNVNQIVAKIILPKEKIIDREIVKVVLRNKSIQSLNLRFNEYRAGKLKLLSPDLQIATIKDLR